MELKAGPPPWLPSSGFLKNIPSLLKKSSHFLLLYTSCLQTVPLLHCIYLSIKRTIKKNIYMCVYIIIFDWQSNFYIIIYIIWMSMQARQKEHFCFLHTTRFFFLFLKMQLNKVMISTRSFDHISRVDVHGGAGRGSGRHPPAADLPGDAVQVLQDRTHALLQKPLWERGYRRR